MCSILLFIIIKITLFKIYLLLLLFINESGNKKINTLNII